MEELFRADHVRDRFHPDRGGRLLGPVDLVVTLALEPDREGEQIGPVLGGQGADGGGVNAARQEGAERGVAAQVNRDRVTHHVQDGAGVASLGALAGRRSARQ